METESATGGAQQPQSDPWFRTGSLERAIHLCATAYYPHRLKLSGPSPSFGLSQRVSSPGPITVGGITYETDVAPGFDEHRASYHVRVPLQGWPEPSHRGLELTSTPALASIYRPDSPMTASRWPGGSRHLAIKIDQFAIDRALKTLVDTQIDPPIPFTAALPLNVCAARTWVQLQEGCQPHLGMSPMTYLRSVRLRRARPDLRLADPSNGGVASSAHRWGFTHLGRFGTAHKTEYGETPLEALRAAQ